MQKSILSTLLIRRWPVFSISVMLYGLGLIISLLIVGGSLDKALMMALSVVAFWVLWFAGGQAAHPYRLYYITLGLLTVLAAIGLLTLPVLDDFYLRTNFLSRKITEVDSHLFPRLDFLIMHRNNLAGLMAIFAPICGAYLVWGRRWWEKALAGVLALVMLAMLLVTNSRGGFVAFAAGLFLLGILYWPRSSHKIRLVLAVVALSTALLAAVYLFVSGQYHLFSPDRLLNENGMGRLEVWKTTFYMLEDVPLTGFGPAQFKPLYTFYQDPLSAASGNFQEHAHNLFLQTYAELGLAGLIAMLSATFLWGRLVWNKFSAGFSEDTKEGSVLLYGGLAAYGALLVYGLTEHSTWNGQFAPLLWIPLGIVAGVTKKPALVNRSRFRLWRWTWRKFIRLPKQTKAAIAVPVLILSITFLAWGFWGLTEVNAAGIQKVRYWQGQENVSLEEISNHYMNANIAFGWSSVPWRGQAWVALAKNQNAQAEKYLREVIKHDPKDQTSLLLLGDVLDRQNRTGEAMEFWRKAKAAPVFYWRGRTLLDTPDDAKAEPYLLRSLEMDPSSWGTYTALVMLYQRHGRTADSIALLEKAQLIFPESPLVKEQLNSLKAATRT